MTRNVTIREKFEAALAKPTPEEKGDLATHFFDPWTDVIEGIYGGHGSDMDDVMIQAMRAVSSNATGAFLDQHGVFGEFAIYVLSGHGMTEYGTSPRCAWVEPAIADLWSDMIAKWEVYHRVMWG